jgi:hypothetical protein
MVEKADSREMIAFLTSAHKELKNGHYGKCEKGFRR